MKIFDGLNELAARVGFADEQIGRKVGAVLARAGALLDELPDDLAAVIRELRDDVVKVAADVAELNSDLQRLRVELVELAAVPAPAVGTAKATKPKAGD